jgi:hypothetical protein
MRVISCLLIAPLLTASVQAMEPVNLSNIGGILAITDSPIVFDYVAPRGGFGEPQMLRGVADIALANMLAEGRMDAATGIDFSDVRGVLSSGQPPEQLTILVGSENAFTAVPETLEANGLETREISGAPAWGDPRPDYAVDIGSRDANAPFGGNLGKARRFAMPDPSTLVNAAGWPVLEEAFAAQDAGPTPAWTLWRETIMALGAGRSNPWIELASGFSISALAEAPDPLDLMLGDDPLKALSKTALNSDDVTMPPYPFAVVAEVTDDSHTAIVFALPYPDRDTAQDGTDILVPRLSVWADVAFPEVTLHEAEDATIAVISLPVEPGEGADVYFQGYGEIMRRQFTPLSLY